MNKAQILEKVDNYFSKLIADGDEKSACHDMYKLPDSISAMLPDVLLRILYSATKYGRMLVVCEVFTYAAWMKIDISLLQLLWVAVKYGHRDVAAILIAKGANVNDLSIIQHSPLFLAAKIGRIDIVTLLLAWGAEVDQTTIYGYTPLCLAVMYGHLDVAKLLISRGARLDIITKSNEDFSSYTLLSLAVECGQKEMVAFLNS